jgi:hypothetical protein
VKKTLTIFAILLLAGSSSLFAVATACDENSPLIALSPPQGFAMTMITGSGFDEYKTVTIAYDGAVQSTIPAVVKTDNQGCFTALISIPDELAVGGHTITATVRHGDSASATFTVVDMTGPQGIQGVAGEDGKDGINGINGLDYNVTGNIYVYNGTNGLDGLDGLDGQNFNATGNVLVYNGTDGLNGKDGTNGINGINGVNGKDGANGVDGAQGPPGSQGLQGTTEQVIITKPIANDSIDFPSFIAIIVIALAAFAAAMIIIYHKSSG